MYKGCLACQHYQIDGTCAAFPRGIPIGIASGEEKHTVRMRSQEGDLVYEPRTPERQREIEAELDSYIESGKS